MKYNSLKFGKPWIGSEMSPNDPIIKLILQIKEFKIKNTVENQEMCQELKKFFDLFQCLTNLKSMVKNYLKSLDFPSGCNLKNISK